MKSKPAVDAAIGKIVHRHMTLDKAESMFTELSKVGGGTFKQIMTRIKRIVKKQRA